MTMQVAMIAKDGIVLASDLKWVTLVETPRGPKRKEEYKSKIKVSGGIAICCAGDMDCATQLADAILSRWRDAERDNREDKLQIVREIAGAPLREKAFECLVAIADQPSMLIYILNAMFAGDGGTEWRTIVSEVRHIQSAGDAANDAKFWLRYYDAMSTVQESIGLAAHLVVEARNFNNSMIDGLEIVVSNGHQFTRLSESACLDLQASLKKQGCAFGELVKQVGCQTVSSPIVD
jgi:hypothetical protein